VFKDWILLFLSFWGLLVDGSSYRGETNLLAILDGLLKIGVLQVWTIRIYSKRTLIMANHDY